MRIKSLLIIVPALVFLSGCATPCCTNYGYYYRPAYVAPVYVAPQPVYVAPVTPYWGGYYYY